MQTHMHAAMRGQLAAQWLSSEYLDTTLTPSGTAVH